jgi:thiol-disulfide isomerase/thioredoxin
MLLAGAMLLAAAPLSAQGLVGKPAPEVSAQYWLNSQPLALGGLRGKIVVVEFWATWCPPCRASIPHLIDLNKKYAGQGVVFMGLTDEPKEKVEPFAQQLGMNYAVGGGSPTGGPYGVRGIPTAFLLDTAGTVVWQGHPMNPEFVTAIDAQLKKTPPATISPEEKAAATAVLDKMDEAIKQEQYAAAAALLAKLTKAGEDPVLKVRSEAARKTLADRAAARLAEAEKCIAAKDYLPATQALADVQALGAGTPAAEKAAGLLKNLMADETARAAVEQGRRENEASAALAEIEKKGAASPAETLKALDDLAARFPGTKAGQAAAERAKTMRADPALVKKVQNEAADKECKGWLSMARNFASAGLPDKARPFLEQIIQKYPDTDYAREARDLLAKIEKK